MCYAGRVSAERIVFLLPKAELQRIDGWAIPAGIPNRSEAIRLLLRSGLEKVTAANVPFDETKKADATA